MRARLLTGAAVLFAVALAGCDGNDEVKKNEGTIVNTPPTTAGAPGAGGSTEGAVSGAAANEVKPPPIPPINE